MAGANTRLMTILRPFAAVLAVAFLFTLNVGECRAADGPPNADRQHLSQLGAGDSVSIQVAGEKDATNGYVGDDGTINVPLVGNIPVAGVSPVEAASRIAKALKDGGYFVDPHVSVIVTQPNSQLVSVLGEVAKTGRYPINPRTTVVDLLAQAGGMKETASDVGYVLRNDDKGHATRYPVSLTGLSELNNSLPTPTLSGGDSLVVPRAEHYYVAGEVISPGAYPIEQGMTVMQAIARAGGVNERGSERRIQLRRKGKNGEYQNLHPKLGDPIQADDMIRVKESIF
jgi:polysaccharide biosynthesis/export protein